MTTALVNTMKSAAKNKVSTHEILFELGCEELPATAVNQLSQTLVAELAQQLEKLNLSFESIKGFATPRRIGIRIQQLIARQPDKTHERRGPSLKAAFDQQGNPTPAAMGFANNLGVNVRDLQQRETSKGTWLYYEEHQPGKSYQELLPEALNQSLAQLPIAKRMRWGKHSTEFVRPVHWAVLMADKKIIKACILGLETGNRSQGHRFHHKEPFELDHVNHYQQRLFQAKVIIEAKDRIERIRAQVAALHSNKPAVLPENAHVLMDKALLNEVSALVEWPEVLVGQFDERFLNIPDEALISSMQSHQKYFPVIDKTSGQLLPYFVFVSNLASKDPQQVIAGNERVIRPRLADAMFFWESDLKRRLDSRISELNQVVFQKQLGTILEKSQRLQWLTLKLSELLPKSKKEFVDNSALKRAAALCKADLVSELVYEFNDLQGIAGRYYALDNGESKSVALAIEEHYLPKHAGDKLPSEPVGQLLAVADRLDTLVGIFGIGQLPTGTKDPYALRRAAIGVLRILVEKRIDLDLKAAITMAIEAYKTQPVTFIQPSLTETLLNFCLDRFSAWYQDQAIPLEVIQAVRSLPIFHPLDFHERVLAVHHFYQQPTASALAAAVKRVSNILSKEKDCGSEDSSIKFTVNPELLKETAEINLYHQLEALNTVTAPLIHERQYQTALDELAKLKPTVDDFFDSVRVMVDDLPLKANRFALLQRLKSLFLQVAEISHLQQG